MLCIWKKGAHLFAGQICAGSEEFVAPHKLCMQQFNLEFQMTERRSAIHVSVPDEGNLDERDDEERGHIFLHGTCTNVATLG